MQTVKSALRYCAVWIVTAVLLIALFFLTASIPREAIQTNMEESSKYLRQKGSAFPLAIVGVNCSKADYYADAVLLNVAYYLDPEHPAESISWARFYSEDDHNWNGMVLEYLPTAVEKQPVPNQQYLRYWHGSLTIVRPLLIWLSIGEIYAFLGTALWLLMGGLIVLLVRSGFRKEALAYVISMASISVWFVPLCLEYLWMFLLMSVTSLITIALSLKQKYRRMPEIFLAVGAVAAFLDFFTTETLTLLIPLAFLFVIRHRQDDSDPDWGLAVKCAVLWGMGYIAMWVSKWAFAAVVLKQDVMSYVQGSINEHLGLSEQLSLPALWLKSIRLNVRNLFTLNYGIIGAVLTLLLFFCLVFVPVLTGRISLRREIQKKWVLLYLGIGAVPFLRFVVLSSHSASHGWFTYRALAASILALILVFYELTDINFNWKQKGSAQEKNEHTA